MMLMLFFGFVLAACDETPGKPKQDAPEFSLELFEGGRFTFSEHKGRPLVINFFASWCIPCKAEAPLLDKVYRDNKANNVAFLGIAVQDTKEKARAFVKEHGMSFPVGVDEGKKLTDLFEVYGIPTTYFIDKYGKINYVHAGMMTEDFIRNKLDQIL